jgi:LmbE family N-acetylglucosaminyl deacetylase
MFDKTLWMKRRIFGVGLAAARTGPGRWLTAAMLRSHEPLLALAAAEEMLSRPWRVLALTAHPDDLEYFAGGTIRRLALGGSQITAAVLSDGEKRGNIPDLGRVRRQEQLAAARKQGIADVRFFGLTDFGLPEDPRLEPTVARVWAEEQPDLVLAFDPKELFPGFANRDHKALGRTVLDLSRKHFGRCRVYLYGTHHANVLVDIGTVLKEKEDAVLTHASQMVYLTEEGHRQALRWLAEVSAAGAPCQYAEPLYRLL